MPIEFQKLVEATVTDRALRKAIDDLVAVKRASAEVDRSPRIPGISEFIESEMARLEQTASHRPMVTPPVETMNELFRGILDEVWHNQQPT